MSSTTGGMYVVTRKGRLLPVASLRVWAAWLEDLAQRTLAKDVIGRSVVSTVLDGIDSGDGKLWVSFVGGGQLDGAGERYASEEAARTGHERLCAWVRSVELRDEACRGK